jgi:hypothetical protein
MEWATQPSFQPDWSSDLFSTAEEIAETDAHEGRRSLLLYVTLPKATYQAVWDRTIRAESPHESTIPPFGLFPALARAFPSRVNVLTQQLRRSLTSENHETSYQAIRGLYHWLHVQHNTDLQVPEVHPDLLREIGFAIAARRQSILIVALDLARWLIEEGPEQYRSLLIDSCTHGLACLLEEASYSRTRAEEAHKMDIPLLRANCIRLAVALKRAGYQDDPAVTGWISNAKVDPLPEVRNSLGS